MVVPNLSSSSFLNSDGTKYLPFFLNTILSLFSSNISHTNSHSLFSFNNDNIVINCNGININDGCGSTHLEGLKKYVVENKFLH